MSQEVAFLAPTLIITIIVAIMIDLEIAAFLGLLAIGISLLAVVHSWAGLVFAALSLVCFYDFARRILLKQSFKVKIGQYIREGDSIVADMNSHNPPSVDTLRSSMNQWTLQVENYLRTKKDDSYAVMFLSNATLGEDLGLIDSLINNRQPHMPWDSLAMQRMQRVINVRLDYLKDLFKRS